MPIEIPAEAHLLIHSADTRTGGHVANALRWLRALYARHDTPRARRFSLQIADLQGRVVFESNDVGALVDVPLPAGTYTVKARHGRVQRGYTLTLAQGRSFDLHLRLTRE